MVAALAVAVVSAVVGAVTNNVVAQAFKLMEKRCQLWEDFPNDIDFIQRELRMIAGAEEDNHSGKGNPRAVRIISMEEMRDLAQDIEDCLDRILRYTELEDEVSFGSRLLGVGRRTGSPPFAAEVKKLKERLKAAHQRKIDYNVNGNQPPAAAAPGISSTSPANTHTHATKIKLVGIDEPKRELLELLDDIEVQPEQLSVISIVGFSGSGKSTLAKAVYDCPDMIRRFRCRAWVQASEHSSDSNGLLMALLQKLCPGVRGDQDGQHLQAEISNFLNDMSQMKHPVLRRI